VPKPSGLTTAAQQSSFSSVLENELTSNREQQSAASRVRPRAGLQLRRTGPGKASRGALTHLNGI